MSGGASMMVVAILLAFGSLTYLLYSLVKSIRNERTSKRSVWREFGLGLSLMILFFTTWFAHGVLQWQTYVDQQRQQDQPTEMGDFVAEFGQSTLENWQSEFLQLFAFVVLAALFIHRGSGESKDGDDNVEASLRRIEEKLGTLPEDAPHEEGERWRLPDTPLQHQDRALRGVRAP